MKRWLTLSGLLLGLGYLASRTGLVLHEIAGHWGAAALCGCRLGQVHLFVFAGGWVDFDCAQLDVRQALAIDLGGIALQLAFGIPLLLFARRRRDDMLGLVCASVGLLWIVHGLFYLVTGVHYGVGDGRTLHRLLGPRRAVLVAAGSALLVAACCVFARGLARRIAPRLPAGSRTARVAALAGAIVLAAGVHGALAWGELRLRADPVYAANFESEAERRVEAELRRYAAKRRRSPEEMEAERRALERQQAVFPLRAVLGVAMAVASVAGIAMAERR